jgi:polyisoprenoid-binding protein YceI
MNRRFTALRKHASRHLALLLLLLSTPSFAITGQAGYHIEPDASQAVFQVRLFWLDNVSGHFTRVDGDVAPGPHPDSWVVDATIPVDSVTMPSSHMRQWLLAPSFFDAKHHPTIHFVSNPVALSQLDHGGTLTVYLTLRGVTAPVHFAVEPEHCTEAHDVTTPCRIVLRGKLRRSTFGMTSDRLAISDNVELNLSITLQRGTR